MREAFRNLVNNVNERFGTNREFDKSKMYDPEFIAFNDRIHGDYEGLDLVEDREELEERYEHFKVRGQVEKRMNEIYANQLQGFATVEEDVRKRAVQEYLDNKIKEDPENIYELRNTAELFAQSQKTLDLQRAELKKYEEHGGSAGLQEKLDLLKKARKQNSWFKVLADNPEAAAKRVEEEYGLTMDQIDEEAQKISILLSRSERADGQVEEWKSNLRGFREELLAGADIAQELGREGRKALYLKTGEFFETADEKTFDEAEKFYEELHKMRNDRLESSMIFGQDADFDYKIDGLLVKFQDRLKEMYYKDLANITISTELGKLEEELKPYLMSKGVAGASSAEMRNRVRSILNEAANLGGVEVGRRRELKGLLNKYSYLV